MKQYNITHSVDPQQFFSVKAKEVAYILGLIWSDGYVYKNGYANVVSVYMIKDDLKFLIPTFQSIGKWNIVERIRKNRKPSLTISINNRPLTDFLIENDYKSKTSFSADKILSIIPKKLHFYWFRGVFDGDGCVYRNEKNYCRSVSIASSYNQDWKYCENVFKDLNIRYTINRRKQKLKNGKINMSSTIRISNVEGIIKFGKYIYPNIVFDGMGLKRKFDKIKEINDDYHLKL